MNADVEVTFLLPKGPKGIAAVTERYSTSEKIVILRELAMDVASLTIHEADGGAGMMMLETTSGCRFSKTV